MLKRKDINIIVNFVGIMTNISKKRHLLKTLTWRIIGSFDTWILVFLVPWFLMKFLSHFSIIFF